VESGKWKVESGKWKVESGKWKVESWMSAMIESKPRGCSRLNPTLNLYRNQSVGKEDLLPLVGGLRL
jgi:hypothetical protein